MDKTILIVDDNKRNIDIIARLLRDKYTIRRADSGETALEIARRSRPDIVLLDIMMPGIDGYEVCRALRSESRYKTTKIIMVSAKAMTSERLEGYDAGADDYITKPFDLNELEAKVKVYARLTAEESARTLVAGLLDSLSAHIGPHLGYLQDTLDLLEDTSISDDKFRGLLRIGQRSVAAIRSTDDEIRLLSDLEQGKHSFQPSPAKPLDLMSRAAERVNWMESGSGCRIETECRGAGLVTVDEDMMVKAISALLEIGLRRCQSGGLVSAVMHVGDECCVEVAADENNQGPGPKSLRASSIALRIVELVSELHGGTAPEGVRREGRQVMCMHLPIRTETPQSVTL